MRINIIPRSEFVRVRQAPQGYFAGQASGDELKKLTLIADMCRLNTLSAVKRAGSGHLGSSFSAMDIVVWLYYREMNTVEFGFKHPDRDIYFSSKGHDVPGLYSVFFSLGVISEELFLKLRRLGGLHGHPDVSNPGIEANSGSLGMGISKGRGMAWSKNYWRLGGRVFVMTGDGEFQEGQNYEALRGAAHLGQDRLIVIMDHNKVQSDKLVKDVGDLGNLEEKFLSFGWQVERCDGNDFRALKTVFKKINLISGKPTIIITDTVKGRGVSFMEHPRVLREKGLYKWHAGAPDDASYAAASKELLEKINIQLAELWLNPIITKVICDEKKPSALPPHSEEYVVKAYGQALVELGSIYNNFIVLDADLAADCHLRDFENRFPKRFIEAGIAEQDMVSMAGGLARQGIFPIINSFGSFLASRANEQIYTNACEGSKIICVCHYAGLIPAGPGRSHQSLRDISLFGAIPNMTIIQPCNALETRLALHYCISQATQNCMLRLNIGPSPRIIQLPQEYIFTKGRGAVLTTGDDAIIFAYGPVMLHEASIASEILAKKEFGLKVVNMPWLNLVDVEWLREILGAAAKIFVLEDHSTIGGLGDFLLNQLVSHGLLSGKTFQKFGVVGLPECGRPDEVLKFHGLDGATLAERITNNI
ncbi:1-deoxy-D-xylulose-5-phosphate synthase [Candidatus Azambacteria bacterium RIFOXYD1_FULL_42_11]|uniref:1-deoxy-D-xylulose-5-phosphate synthase n=1 Tax=Candidatus Azambacteria bacterium RIFOXYD1_FULL_42_11 TaxID=1797310 RepID=A0A1F5CK91_9BACT|nr:MAG: 1-deoxy-D-xylulose-5-phosphate synthase [Candidatus Azambacteria bacterium RIFOXYD1_FULL_42_11]